MSYVVYNTPPRYFPNPGIGFFAGLGDAAYDKALAAYKTDYNVWLGEKKKYDAAVTAYGSAVAQLESKYAQSVIGYKNTLAIYDAEWKKYNSALSARGYAITQMAAASPAIAKKYGFTLPAGYPGCVDKSLHDAMAFECNNTVKGLGAFTAASFGGACKGQNLPVCPAMPKKPTMKKPLPPVKPKYPAQPKALRAEPKPPAAPKPVMPTEKPPEPGFLLQPPLQVQPAPPIDPGVAPPPAFVEVPATPEEAIMPPEAQADLVPPDNSKHKLIVGGLIAVAVLGGGFALYRTFKKPKAA